jgi:hypothetical protein
MKRFFDGTIAPGAAARRFACIVSVGLVVLLAASPASAGLKIRPVFTGGPPPAPEKIAGGGNIEEIFKVAAESWEQVFKVGGGNWDLTIEFGWGPLVSGLNAQERFVSEGGNNPVRMTRSIVTFSSTPDVAFYADPTPRDNAEYKQYTSYINEEVQLNIGRVFTEARGAAANRVDLLTLAVHEIGHALGLDESYTGFIVNCPCQPLTITAPRPFAGLTEFVNRGPHLSSPQALMNEFESPAPGQRRLISGIDALVIAQLSSFGKPDLTTPGMLPPIW